MKRTLYIIAVIVFIGAAFTSCTAARGGCKASQGYVGYGSR